VKLLKNQGLIIWAEILLPDGCTVGRVYDELHSVVACANSVVLLGVTPLSDGCTVGRVFSELHSLIK
jgi:hypothetical protein